MKFSTLVHVGAFALGKFQTNGVTFSGIFNTFGFGDNCSGRSSQSGTCNEGSCPSWSDWSDWGGCSAECDGGIKSRTRDCLNGAENDCSGDAIDEQQCNLQSCANSRVMIYWNNIVSHGAYAYVPVSELSGKGEMLEQCADYCLNKDSCNAVAVTRYEEPDYDYYDYYWYVCGYYSTLTLSE